MSQVLKDEVRETIAAAAVRVFARDGYQDATMAAIARAARVSTGNVYRYYGGKKALFDAVVDARFVARFLELLRGRTVSARGYTDLRMLAADAPYHVASEELLRFAIDHRLRVVVLLGRARGSRYEVLAEQVVQELANRGIAHFRELRPGLRVTAPLRLALDQIYRSLVATMVLVLATYHDEVRIRDAVAAYTRFHLAGLKALFERPGIPPAV